MLEKGDPQKRAEIFMKASFVIKGNFLQAIQSLDMREPLCCDL